MLGHGITMTNTPSKEYGIMSAHGSVKLSAESILQLVCKNTNKPLAIHQCYNRFVIAYKM